MKHLITLAIAVLALSACKPATESLQKASNVVDTTAIIDPNSYAETDKVRITHIALDLRVDMAARTLSGAADLHLDWLDEQLGLCKRYSCKPCARLDDNPPRTFSCDY